MYKRSKKTDKKVMGFLGLIKIKEIGKNLYKNAT